MLLFDFFSNIETYKTFFELNKVYTILLIILPAVIPLFKLHDKMLEGYKKCMLHFMNNKLITGHLFKKLNNAFKEDIECKIGILSTDFDEIEDIDIRSVERNSIYLLDDPNKDYETRKPISDKNKLNLIINDTIHKHYDQLQQKINVKGLQNNPLFLVDYQNEKQSVCDAMKKIYSLENLTDAISKVENSIGADGSVKFIGDKIGICGFGIKKINKKKALILNAYQTDHFTFKVFKYIFKDETHNSVFQKLISRVNMTKDIELKSLLVESMAFLFSSVGLDILIGGTSISGKRKLMVALRNGNIESDHISTLHIPVNESFSKTDIEGEKYSLTTCVIRGIKEELGIPYEIISKGKISFHDFAIVADEGEIGFGCYVDISKVIAIEKCRMYPAQDKFLEIKNIFLLPYPRFKIHPETYEDYFYRITGDDRFCLKWQSFTTLIYQRAILRNLKSSLIASTIIEVVLLILIMYILALIANRSVVDDALPEVFSAIVIIVIHLIAKIKDISHKKGFLKPFVPQWDGDVTVLQSYIDFIDDDKDSKIMDSRRFGMILQEGGKTCYNLSELSLLLHPFCSVRKRSHNYAEYPISFFYMGINDNINTKSLKFINIPYVDNNGIINLYLHITKKEGIVKSIRFTEDAPIDPSLEFNKTFTEDEINSYSKYYNIKDELLRNIKYATLVTIQNWRID